MKLAEAIRRWREQPAPLPPGWRPCNTRDRDGRTVTTRYFDGDGVALAVEAKSDEAADHWDCNLWGPLRR